MSADLFNLCCCWGASIMHHSSSRNHHGWRVRVSPLLPGHGLIHIRFEFIDSRHQLIAAMSRSTGLSAPCEPQKYRNVALLDVDHTLILGDNTLNKPLIECLLKSGVNHAYLFTDMTFNTSAIEDRNALVKALEEYGMAIHGVITPCDVAWPSMDLAECQLLHDFCFLGDTYRGKLHGREFEEFILSKQSVLPSLSRACVTYEPYSPLIALGEAFNEASMENYHNNILSNETKLKSLFAKTFCDHLSEKFGYNHCKGLLLDLLVRKRDPWVKGIIVADDNAQVILDVENFLPIYGLSPPCTELQYSDPSVPIIITALHITTQPSFTTSYMEAVIRGHLEKLG